MEGESDLAVEIDLSGRVALVTGAARGIGGEYARALAACGTQLADRRDPSGAGLRGALALITDVSDEDSTRAMAAATRERFGRIDILANNVARYGDMAKRPWDEVTASGGERMLRVNVIGAFLAAKAVASAMKARGGGKIVNIGSGVVFGAPPSMAHYNASKAAVLGLTRSLARELGALHINVHTLSPGPTEIEATHRFNPPGYGGQAVQRRCIRREEQPADRIGTLLWLCSPLSDFVTGQNVIVDGGIVLQ